MTLAQPANKKRLHLFALGVAGAATIYLLFWAQLELPENRSMLQLWNSAHLILFAVLSFAGLYALRERLQHGAFWKICVSTLLLATVLGGVVELIQGKIGREASLIDWLLDIAGAALGCMLYTLNVSTSRTKTAFSSAEKCWLAVLGIGVVASCTPLVIAVSDDVTAHNQFPVLASFSSPLEVTRFETNIEARLKNGELHVFFVPRQYANLNLKFFPRDWSNYRELAIDLHNPGTSPLALTCRIHDAAHEDSNRYDDRFNQGFSIAPGDNELLIDLGSVARAPVSRRMDMRSVASVLCFTSRLKQPATLVFRQFRLQ